MNPSGKTLIAFEGHMTASVATEIMRSVETELAGVETLSTRKRICHVAMEAMQNILHHARRCEVPSRVEIFEGRSGYHIVTTNPIDEGTVPSLLARIQRLNEMRLGQLNTLYRSRLAQQTETNNSTPGLGLMDIVRKTMNPIAARALRETDGHTMLELCMEVPRTRLTETVVVPNHLFVAANESQG